MTDPQRTMDTGSGTVARALRTLRSQALAGVGRDPVRRVHGVARCQHRERRPSVDRARMAMPATSAQWVVSGYALTLGV